MNKILWIDTETTGLDANKNGIIQIAALYEVNGEIKDRFVTHIKTFDNDFIDPEALKVNELTKEDITGFPSPQLIFISFTDFLCKLVNKYDKSDKLIIAGYNVDFDIRFLKAFWKKNHDTYFGSLFYWVPIDVMKEVVSSRAMLNLPIPPHIKLVDMIEYFDLKVPNGLHDAEVDIEMTRKVYQKIKEQLTKGIKE